MEQSLLLFGIVVPALVALATALAPRGAWHGHRRDLPPVESWGPAAALALAFTLSFASVSGAADFGSERWHSISSVVILAGLAAVVVWWNSPPAGSFLAMLLAFCSLMLMDLPGHDGLAARLPSASIGALLALALVPIARTPSFAAPLVLAASFFAISFAALASGHSRIAFIAMAVTMLLVLLAIPSAINRRFILGAPAAGVAAAAMVALAQFGSSYAVQPDVAPAWWWWVPALAPSLSAAPALTGFARDQPLRRALVSLVLVIAAVAPGVMESFARLEAVARELDAYQDQASH
ncbi:MAG: hypothetical protein O2819_00230 [Planctomycetota bacterium]|nr:hypothetical protein [Planctomycetota bacterium]MDA1105373.1 hypothetical protein [Planctomycetota bacterium]